MKISRFVLSNGRLKLLALGVAGAYALAQWKGWLPQEGGRTRTVGPAPHQREREQPGRSGAGSRKMGVWEELRGCVLVEDRANDGDSFVVRHEGVDHTLRIYFADCPEKRRHPLNGQRLADQGRYFGGLTQEETVRLGEAARDFSLGLLRKQPFTVLTRWERVFDSERFYVFVMVGQGDLAELLVEKGLARIYTKGENRPSGAPMVQEKQKLAGLERGAKSAGAGGWGGDRGRQPFR